MAKQRQPLETERLLYTAASSDEAVWLMVALRHEPAFASGSFGFYPTDEGFEVRYSGEGESQVIFYSTILEDNIAKDDVVEAKARLCLGLTSEEHFYVNAVEVDAGRGRWRIVWRSYEIIT